MKFIKTKRGYWINPAHIKYFSTNDNGEVWVIFLNIHNASRSLFDSDRILIGEFDSCRQADAYVDKLVAKINAEENKC